MTMRKIPWVGARVRILYLGSESRGIIDAVSGDLHEVDVVVDDGGRVRFRLNRATARFLAVGPDAGARMVFDAPAGS